MSVPITTSFRRGQTPSFGRGDLEEAQRMIVVAILRDEQREEASRIDEDLLQAPWPPYASARCAYSSLETPETVA